MSDDLADEQVSVVIASYNTGRYLPLAVESVLGQSYPDVHVWIIDDGSTDDTPAVIQRWRDEPRVHVHRQPNGGQARAKNQGVALSRGRFVAFLDADDVWLPDKLVRQMPLFSGQPEVGVVYSDYELMDGDGRKLPKGPILMHRGWVSGALLIENFVPFPSAVVRRTCLERHGPFDESLCMGIDYDLWLRLSPHYQFDFIPDAMVRYRIWSGQMSKNYRQRYESAIGIMQRFLADNDGVVEPAVVRRAWTHTYVGRGDCILWNEKDRLAAMRDYARALAFGPLRWAAWRAILRSLVTKEPPAPG
jgi:glycosyltransferase involved in cell wall biosynthesis